VSYLDAIILGIIQGLTEFLPVSSSGHLVLVESILGVKQPGVSFELLVHLGTFLSVLAYFRRRILRLLQSLFVREMRRERGMVMYLVIGSIPAGVIGILFADFFERTFTNPLLTAALLIVTGIILLTPKLVRTGANDISCLSAITMGVGQALAIFPGISRSGSTIAFGMLAGVDPSRAAEFSFLLALPAIAGAVLIKSGELMLLDAGLIRQYLVGFAFAFLLGLVAVYAVMGIVRRGKFEYFAYYCFAVGAVGLYLFS